MPASRNIPRKKGRQQSRKMVFSVRGMPGPLACSSLGEGLGPCLMSHELVHHGLMEGWAHAQVRAIAEFNSKKRYQEVCQHHR